MAYDKRTNTIRVDAGSDFLADQAIFLIQTLKKLSIETDLSSDLLDDWRTIEKWLGCEGREISQGDSERIINAWKIYMEIGLAPSFALQPAFDIISQQYQEAANPPSGERPPAEVMDVFDRLLATKKEILDKRRHDIENERIKLQKIFSPNNKNTKLINKLVLLSKLQRLFIVLLFGWLIWVVFRTSGNHEFLGHDFDRWDDDIFLVNLIIPPLIVWTTYKLYRWIIRASH